MANNNDIVSRIRSAPTKEERVALAFDYAKRDPEGAKALGWENPLLAWQLYNEAQEVGAPLGELGLEGGHSMLSAADSFDEGGEGAGGDDTVYHAERGGKRATVRQSRPGDEGLKKYPTKEAAQRAGEEYLDSEDSRTGGEGEGMTVGDLEALSSQGIAIHGPGTTRASGTGTPPWMEKKPAPTNEGRGTRDENGRVEKPGHWPVVQEERRDW